jgi:integrase
MKIDAKMVARATTLPPNRTDVVYWDSTLTGFGYRLRQHADGIRGSYVVQYRRGGKSRRYLVGSAAKLTAAEARAEAKRILSRVTLGADPQEERKLERQPATAMRVLAEDYIRSKSGLRPSSMREVARYLRGPYFRSLHGHAVADITRRDIAEALTAIERKGRPVAAKQARTTLGGFFQWCMRQGLTDTNPVVGTGTEHRPESRNRVLTDAELATVWRATQEDDFGKIVRLLILLGSRRGEIGGMAWSELDIEARTWTLPAVRSKNHRELKLPLLGMAFDIIKSVPRLVGRDQLFGHRAGTGFENWFDAKRRLRDGIAKWNLHDIRRTVATRMGDIGILPHVIEAALNHASGSKAGVAGIYNKSPYEAQVKAALALWESHIAAIIKNEPAVVVSLDFPKRLAVAS